MRLFIAEKPELARAIAVAISGTESKKQGYIQKDSNYITWALGHILELQEPHEYDEKYKTWNINTLPFSIFQKEHFKYKPKKNSKDQLKVILDLIKSKEITEIIHCGDADDEGQILIDEIIEYSKSNKPVKRCLINDLTPKAIQQEIANLKDNKEFFGISQRGFARSYADWIVGLNLTRAYTIAYGNKNDFKGIISVGRVQTPILALVVNRDLENKNHTSKEYFILVSNFDNGKISIEATLKTEEMIETEEEAKQIYNSCLNKPAIFEIKSQDKTENPPLPYNLLDLQAELAKKGYKPDEVLKITQELREKFQCISYNRSDCNYLPTNIFDDRKSIINCIKNNFGLTDIGQNSIDINIKSKAFDDSKITAHYGIIPLATKVNLNEMNESQKEIYSLIAKRFLMQFLKPCLYKEHQLSFKISSYEFCKTIKEIKQKGFKEKYTNDDEEEQNTNIDMSLLKNPNFIAKYIAINPMQTKPKPKYTMATLLKDLASVAKYVKDEKIKKLLQEKDKGKKGENGGIGTPATRSNHISNLILRGYINVSKDKKQTITATAKGLWLIETLPKFLTTPELTALWSEQQNQISNRELSLNDFLIEVKEQVAKEIKSLSQNTQNQKENNMQDENAMQCPECKNGIMILKKGAYGDFFACNNYNAQTKEGCKFTMKCVDGKPVSKEKPNLTNFECPECHSKLIEKNGISKKNNRPYTLYSCSNYPQCKYSTFEKPQ